MATEPRYTVLPVSEVKRHYRAVYDALEAGETVYVAKRGKVVAAFLPFTEVPDSIVALHRSPILTDLPVVAARQLGHDGVSEAVADAEAGLPRLVERDGRVYGMLTAAQAPTPDSIPDPEVIGARAEALLAFQESHPDASIDDIMNFSDSLEQSDTATAQPPAWPLRVVVDDRDGVRGDSAQWSEHGSRVEDVVVGLLSYCDQAVGHRVADPARHVAEQQAFFDSIREFGRLLRGNGVASMRGVLVEGERLEAAGNWVDARTAYVQVLIASWGDVPDAGVLWRLGNLDRRAGLLSEGAWWFWLALTVNKIADSSDEQPHVGSRADARWAPSDYQRVRDQCDAQFTRWGRK